MKRGKGIKGLDDKSSGRFLWKYGLIYQTILFFYEFFFSKTNSSTKMEANRDSAETCVTRAREAAARGFAKSCIFDLM